MPNNSVTTENSKKNATHVFRIIPKISSHFPTSPIWSILNKNPHLE